MAAMINQQTKIYHPLIGLLAAVFLLAGCSAAVRPPEIPPTQPPGGESRYAPYWYIDDNTDSFLEIKSHFRKSAITLFPTALMPYGELKLNPIKVPPLATVRVALKSQLRGPPSRGTEPRRWGDGSRPNSAWGGLRLDLMTPSEATAKNFNGWILVENPSERLGSMSMLENPKEALGSNLEGLWWAPYVDTQVYFALENTTESPLAVRLILSDEKGSQVGTSEFKVDKLGARLINVREVLGAQALPQIGSASFSTTAKPGAIVIRGRLLQEKVRFSASWKLQETGKLTNVPAGTKAELHAPAAYFGKLNQLTHRGEAYLHPHLILKNVSERKVTVIGAAYGKDKDTKPAQLKLEPVTLLPNHTVHIDLEDKRQKDKNILADGAAGVRLSHDGGPTDVVAELLSIDETGQVVFYDDVRSLFLHKEIGTMHSAISFNLEDENRSFLIIKNTTDEPRQARIILHYNDGRDHYEVNLQDVPPQQIEIIDFRHLRDEKIPDVGGNILPPDLKFGGSVIFSDPGAFVISDPTFLYASTTTPAGDPADIEPFFLPSCCRLVSIGEGPPECAVPTNFRQDGPGTDVGNGTLRFFYEWNSSTGNLADLSACTVGEIVSYPDSRDPWPLPSPPFPPNAAPNPTIIDLPATDGTFEDHHSLGRSTTFVRPFSNSSFTALQDYRYRCPCRNAGRYVNLVRGLSIVRSVSQNNNGSWKFTVTKSGSSATINPIP